MMYLGKNAVSMTVNQNVFPDNVKLAKFTLNEDLASDLTIPNPFNSVAYKRIVCLKFDEDAAPNDLVGFFANFTQSRDSNTNRKLIVHSTEGGIVSSAYFPLIAYTKDTITLRAIHGGNFTKGTYYLFAWGEEANNNG